MLEVLPEYRVGPYDPDRPFRIAVVAYVPDVSFVDELARCACRNLPPGFDLIVTTGDGGRARAIETRVAQHPNPPFAHFETRVSWIRRGVDKAALLIACRDVILGDQYDLLVWPSTGVCRRSRPTTCVTIRGATSSTTSSTAPATWRTFWALFQREPGSRPGLPADDPHRQRHHGRADGDLYRRRRRSPSAKRLGVRVPLDRVTPLGALRRNVVRSPGRPSAARPRAMDGQRLRANPVARRYDRTGPGAGASPPARGRANSATTAGRSSRRSTRRSATPHSSSRSIRCSPPLAGYPVEQIRFMHRARPDRARRSAWR